MKFLKKYLIYRIQLIIVFILSISITMIGQNRLIKPNLSGFGSLNATENFMLTKFKQAACTQVTI